MAAELEGIELWERPEAEELHMIVGWRQWADAGSISSALPRYLIQQLQARQIGRLEGDAFYLFQIPGTHDLVRPVVRYVEGYPEALETPLNELYYAEDGERGLLIFIGDEPHLHVERYVAAILDLAEQLEVRRIIGLGGVYGEMPYDKERLVSCVYSLKTMKQELEHLAVSFSGYQGGASIGSFLCRRAGEREMEYVSFYAFVPTYDFSELGEASNGIRLENDFTAWLGVLRRIDYMLNWGMSLGDLEEKSDNLRRVVEEKVSELDLLAPQLGIREYLARLSEEFVERPFNPLEAVWEEELRDILEELDDEQG